MAIPSGERVVRLILPLNQYRAIREDLVNIYIAAYYEYSPATEAFSKLSVPELQDQAGQKAVAALNYDPNAAVGAVQKQLERLVRWISLTLVSVFLVGVGVGLPSLVTLSRQGAQILTTVSGILLTAVAGSSTTVGVVAGLIFLYVWLLSASSMVIGVINEEMVYGPNQFNTREHTRLVGYTIWNSSLDGVGAVRLLLIFSSLKLLSAFPGINPYHSVRGYVTNNIDLFVHADGLAQAFCMSLHRIWEEKREDYKKERS